MLNPPVLEQTQVLTLFKFFTFNFQDLKHAVRSRLHSSVLRPVRLSCF